jgi:two-component system sensor histidine kinase CpxA
VALALARRKAGADADVDLDRIEVEAERMNDLIGRLLALARAESSTGRDAMGPVDVGDVVTRVADDARYEAQQQRKDVRLEATEPVVVAGDAQVLASAVDNVVRNAVRHTAADSSVEITVERRGDDAVVRVRDHGPGVPPAELERIFRHSTVSSWPPARQRRRLGLAIARRAVAVHGGSIRPTTRPTADWS